MPYPCTSKLGLEGQAATKQLTTSVSFVAWLCSRHSFCTQSSCNHHDSGAMLSLWPDVVEGEITGAIEHPTAMLFRPRSGRDGGLKICSGSCATRLCGVQSHMAEVDLLASRCVLCYVVERMHRLLQFTVACKPACIGTQVLAQNHATARACT
jgi:hypothetical protein